NRRDTRSEGSVLCCEDFAQDWNRLVAPNEDVELIEWAHHWFTPVPARSDRRNFALAFAVPRPQKETDSTVNVDFWERIFVDHEVDNLAKASVRKHFLADRPKSHTAGEPACRDDERKKPGIQALGLLNKKLVDRCRLTPRTARVQLVGRVAND